jgi:hypothetical protein
VSVEQAIIALQIRSSFVFIALAGKENNDFNKEQNGNALPVL